MPKHLGPYADLLRRQQLGMPGGWKCRAVLGAPLTNVAWEEDSAKRVVAFCSACHVMPLAESFPRDAWHHEVMRGYEFYAKSGRKDLDPPPPKDAIAYFRGHASEQLDLRAMLEEMPSRLHSNWKL